MTLPDALMVIAVLIAPVLAVQVQKRIEELRERRHRRQSVFEMLMATRSSRISPQHVQALNMIDLEFYGPRILGIRLQSAGDRQVSESWRVYHDHLSSAPAQPDSSEQWRQWNQRGDALFIDLLYAMSRCLSYTFDKVQLSRGCYSPKAHGDEEAFQRWVKALFAEVLSGKRPLLVAPYSASAQDAVPTARIQDDAHLPAECL